MGLEDTALSIMQHQDAFLACADAVESEDLLALAHKIAAELEDLATSPSSDRLHDLIVARRSMDRLRGLFLQTKSHRPLLRRGAAAMREIRCARTDEIIKLKDERELAYADRVATIASRRSAWAHSETQRRRIIRIVAAAAVQANPQELISHVRQCGNIWKSLGPCGPKQRELFEFYLAATTDFWNAVREETVTSNNRTVK